MAVERIQKGMAVRSLVPFLEGTGIVKEIDGKGHMPILVEHIEWAGEKRHVSGESCWFRESELEVIDPGDDDDPETGAGEALPAM